MTTAPATFPGCNRRRFLLLPLLAILLAVPATGQAGIWQQLTVTARSYLDAGNRPAGRVTHIQGETVILQLSDPRLVVGSQVAVKNNNIPGVPLPLQDNLALIRLTQKYGTQARGVIIEGSSNFRPGTIVYPYTYNRLYVYTNLANPYQQPPFRDLTIDLQQARIPYALRTYQQLQRPEPGIRPLIIRLEGRGTQVIGQLTDRDGMVLATTAYNYPYRLPVAAPYGLPLNRGSFVTGGAAGAYQAPGGGSFTRPEKVAARNLAGHLQLKGTYKRLYFADLNGDGREELVFLSQKRVEVFHLGNRELHPVTSYRLPGKDIIPLNLHAGDFNHNGKDEVYVTLGKPITTDDGKPDTKLASLVLELGPTGAFHLLGRDYPYYFRVMETREGKKVLLAQKMDDFKQYQLPVRWAGFFNGKLQVRGEYREARDVFSLDNFVLNPFNQHQIMVLDQKGNLGGFDSRNSELLTTAGESFGLYDEVTYLQKRAEIDYEGGFVIKDQAHVRFAPRRFMLRNSFGRQAFLIAKERRVRPELLEQGIELLKGDEGNKKDQVVGVQWKGNDIAITWRSPKLPRDVVDFGFTKVQGRDTMVILTRNEAGKYALEMIH